MPKTAKAPDLEVAGIEQEISEVSGRVEALEREQASLDAAPPPEWDALDEAGTERRVPKNSSVANSGGSWSLSF